MKTRTTARSAPSDRAEVVDNKDEKEVEMPTKKRRKNIDIKESLTNKSIIYPWTNIQTEEYLTTLKSQDAITPIIREENTIQTVAARYSKAFLERIVESGRSVQTCNGVATRNSTPTLGPKGATDKRTSGRISVGSKDSDISEQYRIDDTSMGFGWWSNIQREDGRTQKQYNRSSSVMTKGFNGEITLAPLAGPQLAFAFVVPCVTQIGMMTTFKTMPNQMMIRQRMKELSSMKTCYYTQLHWKKGVGHNSHLNESDWKDNPLLDPTASLLLDAYMASLSNALSTATQWKVQYKTLCSVIETGKAGHQAPHIDDKGCLEKEVHFRPFILHHPLCEEGSSLQIWLPNNKGSHSPTLIHIPFGTALLLRGDVYHAGSYGSTGNLRFHAHLTPHRCTADGRELGIMNIDSNERLRETDLPAEEVNNILLQNNKEQCKFTSKYIKQMKKVLPVTTFWDQNPEKNVTGQPKRTEYS
jgi:hypothetical protein